MLEQACSFAHNPESVVHTAIHHFVNERTYCTCTPSELPPCKAVSLFNVCGYSVFTLVHLSLSPHAPPTGGINPRSKQHNTSLGERRFTTWTTKAQGRRGRKHGWQGCQGRTRAVKDCETPCSCDLGSHNTTDRAQQRVANVPASGR